MIEDKKEIERLTDVADEWAEKCLKLSVENVRLTARICKLNEVLAASREVAAWFTSGNSVNADIEFVARSKKESIKADVDRLNSALKAVGG